MASRAGVWWERASWFADVHFLAVSSDGRVQREKRRSKLSFPSSYQGPTLTLRLYPYELIVSQRSHVLILPHWGFGTQHMNIVVQSLSWPTLCHLLDLSIPVSSVLQYLLEFAQIHVLWVVMLCNHLILCPLLFLPSIFYRIRVFSSESALHVRWPKYRSVTFSISPSNEYSWLIWFHLLVVQGTLTGLLQHHSLKASILQPSAFFIVPTLTSIHDYWKNHSFD